MMLNDSHIAQITDFINSKDCFPNASIGGGILFYLWNYQHKGLCKFTSVHNGVSETSMRVLNEYDTFIRYNNAIAIATKVRDLSNQFMSSVISSRNPFGLSAATDGHTISVTTALTTFSQAAKTSTSSFSTPKFIPTPADKRPNPPRRAQSQNSRQPANAPRRKTLLFWQWTTATVTSHTFLWARI